MTGKDYRYQEMIIKLSAGGQDFTRFVAEFDLYSRRVSPVRLLECSVGNIGSPAQGGRFTGKVKEGDAVSLTWGPDEKPDLVFKGTVTTVFNTRTVRFIAKDDGQKLIDTITTKTTTGETTSQIVKRIVSEAGLNPGKVTTQMDKVFDHWAPRAWTVNRALVEIKRALIHSWGLDAADLAWWVDMDQVFHFGTRKDKTNGWNTVKEPLKISNKVNLSEMTAPTVTGGQGRVLTHPWPYFDHSQEVSITDDRLAQVSDTFWIDSVHLFQRGSRARSELFIRMKDE